MPSQADQIQRAVDDLIKQRLYEEALLYLDEIEKGEGGINSLVEYLRGHVFIAMRDFSQARKHYELSFENEFRVHSAEMIATLLLAEGRLESSIDFLEATIAREAENTRLLKYDLCKFYVISDRYAEAERIMGEILPGLIPPLPRSIADDALTFRAAITCEFDSLEDYPNIKSFLSLIDGDGKSSNVAARQKKGAISKDVSGS